MTQCSFSFSKESRQLVLNDIWSFCKLMVLCTMRYMYFYVYMYLDMDDGWVGVSENLMICHVIAAPNKKKSFISWRNSLRAWSIVQRKSGRQTSQVRAYTVCKTWYRMYCIVFGGNFWTGFIFAQFKQPTFKRKWNLFENFPRDWKDWPGYLALFDMLIPRQRGSFLYSSIHVVTANLWLDRGHSNVSKDNAVSLVVDVPEIRKQNRSKFSGYSKFWHSKIFRNTVCVRVCLVMIQLADIACNG